MPKTMAAKSEQSIESMIEELQSDNEDDNEDDDNLSKSEYQTVTAHYLATQNE